MSFYVKSPFALHNVGKQLLVHYPIFPNFLPLVPQTFNFEISNFIEDCTIFFGSNKYSHFNNRYVPLLVTNLKQYFLLSTHPSKTYDRKTCTTVPTIQNDKKYQTVCSVNLCFSLTDYTGYVQAVTPLMKRKSSSNHYCDVNMQVSENGLKLIRVM